MKYFKFGLKYGKGKTYLIKSDSTRFSQENPIIEFHELKIEQQSVKKMYVSSNNVGGRLMSYKSKDIVIIFRGFQ